VIQPSHALCFASNLNLARWKLGLAWGLLLTALMFFGSIALVRWLILRLPVDYLNSDRQTERSLRSRHPAADVILLVVRNLAGLLLIIIGVVMLLTPGQGVMCILFGLGLLDFPGKQAFVRRLLGRRRVLDLINSIRDKGGRPPLETP
jgi:hypothetical protein